MTDKKIILSREGLAELQEELRFLREEKRIEIAEKLKEAISYGDLSENAEYQTTRDEQAQVELRIEELEAMLKPGNYDLINTEKKKKTGIHVGSTVVLKNEEAMELKYIIVGSQEANILENKISNESPLGKAILGKNVHDTFTFDSPGGQQVYTILSIQ